MKIYVGVPCGGSILTKTVNCLIGVVTNTKLHRLVFQDDTYCDRGHNELVAHAIESGADALMFFDSDQEFPDDTIERLAAHNKDIVGCAYRRRQPPFPLMPDSDGTETGLKEVDWLPSGVMLVKTKVFKEIAFPWFPNLYGKKPEDFIGSDLSFCRKAKFAGFNIFCDYTLSREVTHLVTIPLTFEKNSCF